jgi:hypothetical protein
MISVTNYGDRTNMSPDVFQKIKDATVHKVNGTLLSERKIAIDNNPGIEFEMTGEDGYHGRCRYYIVGHKLIGLASYAGQGKPLPPDTTRMLDSLRILKPTVVQQSTN